MKIPVVKTDDFTIYFERYKDKTFTHADVRKWNKKVKKQFIYMHYALHMFHGEPFFALVDNKKLTKFVYLLGYKPFTQVTCNDGVPRTVWIFNGE